MSENNLLRNGLTGCVALMLFVSASSSMSNASDVLTMEVSADQYQITSRTGGQVIEMEGFGYLMVPGKPMLPAKNFLIALPPGARILSVEVNGIGASQLPGTYQITPTPPILPLSDSPQYERLVQELQDEWQSNNQSVYSSDQPYPDERGELKASGTLRKYSYASVSFYPFSYHPQSGRLIHYHAAQIVINYDLPTPGGPEAQRTEEFKCDDLADERASRLFVNYPQIEDLYQPTGSQPAALTQMHDYVIITSTTLQSAIVASNFLDWKASLGYNLRTVFTTDPEIAGQAGGDLAEKIRNFLRYNYLPWGIEYVLLVGDYATIPMRYCFPDSSNHSYYPHDPYTYGGEVPTDYYYADLSASDAASWDSDGDGFRGEYGQDSPDFLAEVYVGRIPTNNSSRITYTLNKLVAFEQDTGPWKNQALHAGAIVAFANQDHSGHPVVDGARMVNLIEADLMTDWTVSRYSEQAGLAPSEYPWPALNLTAFTDDWRNGQYAVVNWEAHGSTSGVGRMVWVWDDGDGVPETDGSDGMESPPFVGTWATLDDDYPSIVFAVSCNVGCPEPNPQGNLGIDLLTEAGFGASAGVVSATRGAAVAIYWDSIPGMSESICYEFNRFMINGPGGPEKVGNALYDSKFHCNHNYPWDHYYDYKNLFDFNLYGDPALAREGALPFTLGDCNGDGSVDPADVVYLINYLFRGGSAPDPLEAGDCNCDSVVDPADVVYLINYLFRQGPPPGA
jgi:hypothetical protein